LHEHEGVLAALRERGITDASLVLFDVWTYGKAMMPEQWRDRRLGWCDVWMRETPKGNPYAHPVSGLKIIVDMNTFEVLQIEDHHDYGLSEVDGEYDPRIRGTQQRSDLKPLEISQPEGVSFTVDGNELRWQNWSMRLGFNFREGPVIYQVAFDDQGTNRDIAYRMSFPEMGGAVPRSGFRPLPADRVRHRRVGTRVHDHVAGAGLRLSGRDRVPRRGGAR
jgi:primary-amine oxidase